MCLEAAAGSNAEHQRKQSSCPMLKLQSQEQQQQQHYD
jgi:hypothetical protein